jgi:hypothetical protein
MLDKNGKTGIFYPVQVVFLTLKLANLVDWDWWFVFLPSIIWLVIMFVYLFLKAISKEI